MMNEECIGRMNKTDKMALLRAINLVNSAEFSMTKEPDERILVMIELLFLHKGEKYFFFFILFSSHKK